MLRIILVTLCAWAALAMEWPEYKEQFGKTYTSQEDLKRQTIYLDNLAYINRHNAEADQGLHTFWLGVNQFADMTNAEFRRKMNGFRMHKEKNGNNIHRAPVSVADLPDSVDWRTKGFVTPIKDQKQCGSCWAFSAVGSLEGQHFNKTGKLVSLSEQNLVDCSKKQGNDGCGGGWMDYAFKYIKMNHGIDTEASYPYKAIDEKCKFKKDDIGATLTGFKDVEHKSEEALQSAIATVGPISVAIDASQPSFQLYKKGVYTEKSCSTTALDHGVTAVGYGSLNNKDYYIVKNSWGTTWGESGYILMARNHKNMCGIATQASYPIV